jgi:hypothetical protein
MYCGGGDLGFPIGIKYIKFVEDFPMIIPLPRNDHWKVLYKFYVFYVDRKSKMAATAIHRLTLDPMGKMFQNDSALKPLGQLKPNCPGMIIGKSSTNFMYFMPIGNPRSPPSP